MNTVLIALRLRPSDTVFLSRASTVAVGAGFACPAAHAALLAREPGIPMLLRTGIRSLSVAAALVPEVKIAIRGIKITKKGENHEAD